MECKIQSPNRSCCKEDSKEESAKDNRSEITAPIEKLILKKRPRLIANITNTQYEIIREVLETRFKCKFVESESECDILWYDTGVTEDILMRLRPYQRINHFPAMYSIHKKNFLCKNLNKMRKELPKEYNFFPRTWSLPVEWLNFRNQFDDKKSKTFIIKPEALSQGKGIFLTRSPDTICPTEHYVAQQYINKPFLIDGLKFDLRIYVLVYGSDPLRIYVYKEGLVRLATELYVPPTASNLTNFFIHLTNYAINKNSENFVYNIEAKNADIGHKRSLEFLWKYIDENGGNSILLRKQIYAIIVKTLCAIQPQLASNYRACQPSDLRNDICFEILGFDILIDHKLRPWLLEVNHTPSFTTDTPFDQRVKFDLIADTMTLLKLNPRRRTKYIKKKEIDDYNKRIGKIKGSVQKLSKEEKDFIRHNKMEKRDIYEMSHFGGYERIYPDIEDPFKYKTFLETAQRVWEGFYCGKKRIKALTEDTPYTQRDSKQMRPPISLHKNPKVQIKNIISIKSKIGQVEPRYMSKFHKEENEEPESRLADQVQSEPFLPTIPKLPSTQEKERSLEERHDINSRKNRKERIEGIIKNFLSQPETTTILHHPTFLEAKPPPGRCVPLQPNKQTSFNAFRAGQSDLNYINIHRRIHVPSSGGFLIPKVLDFNSKEGLAPAPTPLFHKNVL